MYTKVLIFLGGAAIGSALTYFYVKDKYEKIVDEEIQSVKEEYAKSYEAKKTVEVLNETKTKILENVMNKASEIGMGPLQHESHTEAPVNYNIFSKPRIDSEEENDDEDEDEIPNYAGHPTEGIAGVPYTISPELFVNDKKNFDKITLEYYEGNDILVEEMSDEPVNIDESIGRDSLRMFGEFERDLVYVRNERLETDFEVFHHSGSYVPD